MLVRMYTRSFFITVSRARRTDLGYLLPTIKLKNFSLLALIVFY